MTFATRQWIIELLSNCWDAPPTLGQRALGLHRLARPTRPHHRSSAHPNSALSIRHTQKAMAPR